MIKKLKKFILMKERVKLPIPRNFLDYLNGFKEAVEGPNQISVKIYLSPGSPNLGMETLASLNMVLEDALKNAAPGVNPVAVNQAKYIINLYKFCEERGVVGISNDLLTELIQTTSETVTDLKNIEDQYEEDE